VTIRTVPDISRSATAGVTTPTDPDPTPSPWPGPYPPPGGPTQRAEYDPNALLAEIVIRFEHAGLLPVDRRVPDPRGAHEAAAALLRALGVNPVDLGMQKRIARRVAALAGDRR
jgi:hypothetical protein